MSDSTDKKRGSFGLGLAIGVLCGLVASSCLGGVLGYAAVQKAKADVRRGWNLVPVIVASQDIPRGMEISTDALSQRSIPEQFVTSSLVGAASAQRVVGQKAAVALQAGDPVRWSDVGLPSP